MFFRFSEVTFGDSSCGVQPKANRTDTAHPERSRTWVLDVPEIMISIAVEVVNMILRIYCVIYL
jgi:hypothetical protein